MLLMARETVEAKLPRLIRKRSEGVKVSLGFCASAGAPPVVPRSAVLTQKAWAQPARAAYVHTQQVISEHLLQLRDGDSEVHRKPLAHRRGEADLGRQPVDRFAVQSTASSFTRCKWRHGSSR